MAGNIYEEACFASNCKPITVFLISRGRINSQIYNNTLNIILFVH